MPFCQTRMLILDNCTNAGLHYVAFMSDQGLGCVFQTMQHPEVQAIQCRNKSPCI